jgi:hypothetical protein
MSFLVQLLLGGSLTVVVLFLGLIVWRLTQLPRSGQPTAEQPGPARTAPPVLEKVLVPIPSQREFDDLENREEHTEPVQQVDDPVSQPKGQAVTLDLPRLPKSLTTDQVFEQRLQASEDDLRRQLAAVPEVRLLSDAEVRKIRKEQQDDQRNAAIPAETNRISYATNLRLQQMMKRAALQAGLELQSGPKYQLRGDTAFEMGQLSKSLRDLGFVSVPGVTFADGFASGATASLTIKNFQTWCDQHRLESYPGTVPTLTQMLQIESEVTRLLLVRELRRIRSTTATTQLAGRALLDLSPAVRRAAVAGLEGRPGSPYVPVLLQGLRYPWPPVADHAAVALCTLKPQEAVAPLVDLLDLPSPSAPVLDAQTNEYSVRELVRLNHLRSCLLCHAPSLDTKDGIVRGLVPTPGTALPSSNGGGYYEAPAGDFIRADITYLHQDFSANLPEKDAEPWPHEQRFDFVTRRRALAPSEMADISASPATYPQRDAVLYALRGITGKDGGTSSQKWRELLGIAKGDRTDKRSISPLESGITAKVSTPP